MADKNANKTTMDFTNNYRELMGYISSAFMWTDEEEIAHIIAALYYLRKENSLWITKESNVNHERDHVVFNTGHGQYDPQFNGYCLCCEKAVIEKITSKDFKALLLSALKALEDASVKEYVFLFVDALNKQTFQDGELLALLDRYLRDMNCLRTDEFSQPKELSQIISQLLDKESQDIYDPFGGLMDFATTMPDKHFVAYEINETTRNLALFRLALADLLDKTTIYNKSAECWTEDKYDAIVTFPPFGRRMDMRDTLFGIQTEADQAVLSRFEKTTNDNGQLIIVVPLSTLFRESSRSCRETITKNNWLDSVVVLPNSFFQSTNIASAIVVLKKNRKEGETIRFVDVSKGDSQNNTFVEDVLFLMEASVDVFFELTVEVTTADVLRQNSSWLVGWYLYQHNAKYGEGCSIVPFIDVLATASSSNHFVETSGSLVTNESLSRSSLIHFDFKPENFITTNDLGHARKITQPVLLISQTSAVFPMYCEASEENPIFVKPNIGAYTISDENIVIGYLCIELFHRISDLNRYVALHSNKKLFEKIVMAFPSVLEQKNLFENMRRTAQEGQVRELRLQDTIDSIVEENKKEFRARKHALMQNTLSISADWGDLKDYLLSNEGRFDENDIIGYLNPISVGDLVKSITENLLIIEDKVKHLSDDDWDWGNVSEIDIQEFIKEYIDSHKTTRWWYSFIKQDQLYVELYDDENNCPYSDAVDANWKIMIPKKALIQVFDNIVSNARAHGFVDPGKKKYCIRFEVDYTVDSVELYISNNGHALEDGVDTEFVRTNGSSTKLNERTSDDEQVHSGFGGYETDSILKRYNATMEIFSNPNSLYPVTYKIVFKDIRTSTFKYTI